MQLPQIELPYETMTHKEVRVKDPLYILHPYGKRYYAWFTYDKVPICYLMELSGKRIIKTHNVTACFHPDLALGTLLYGTIVYYQDKRCFVIDNILQDRGKIVKDSYYNKLKIMEELLMHFISSSLVVSNQIMFMLPVMNTSIHSVYDIVPLYKVYCIKIIPLHGEHKIFNYIKKNTSTHSAIFRVESCIKSDLYELYTETDMYQYAYIDTYKRSIMMNDIFRNIPENHNLDRIEESDDEEEFKSISKVMECEWNLKFGKWIPVGLSNSPLTNIVSVQRLERL